MRDLGIETAGGALHAQVSDGIALGPGVVMQGTRMRFQRNEEIFGEGEKAEYVYRVVSGAVRTTASAPIVTARSWPSTFRESSIRPFRDVLLGLFFIGIGMRFDPAAIPPIWHWTLFGALLILASKTLIVAAMVRRIGVDAQIAWRTGLLLSVGGEFGLALIAIALDAGVIDMQLGQIAITSVLLSMIAGAILVRCNGVIAARLTKSPRAKAPVMPDLLETSGQKVVIGGYGRVGHTIAVLLHSSGVPFLAFDTDAKRVAQGRSDGHPVSYGDVSDPELLTAIHVERASLVVITVDKPTTALRAITFLRKMCPQVPVIARARDLKRVQGCLTPAQFTPIRKQLKQACASAQRHCRYSMFRLKKSIR